MKFDKESLPKHIGIIMDGNRRWAKSQGLPISQGHKEGAETLKKIAKYANKIGIEYITVYAFSTENWKRAKEEVSALMLILQNYVDDFLKKASTDNIKIQFLGDITVLSKNLQKSINNCIEKTKNNTGLTLNIAFNYGGRTELIRAIKEIAKKVENNTINIEEIDEETVANELYTAGQPDPDLVIRTSGEERLGNFLPWQVVYSELLFVEKYWPAFDEEDLDNAITEYQKRTRNFGAN